MNIQIKVSDLIAYPFTEGLKNQIIERIKDGLLSAGEAYETIWLTPIDFDGEETDIENAYSVNIELIPNSLMERCFLI